MNVPLSNSTRRAVGRAIFVLGMLMVWLASEGIGFAISDETLSNIRFDQRLNAQLSPELTFVNEDGNRVKLGDYFNDKPVILVLGYYRCPMLCTLVINGMVESLQDIKWTIGKEFTVVNVSINPAETPALAQAKKRSYLKGYGRPRAEKGWHFLTGSEENIRQLAQAVGFQYQYDPISKEYAHPSGLIFLTPAGKISGYRFGVTFMPQEVFGSLEKASTRTIGTRIQDLVLLCFHYRPITGKYGGLIMLIVRLLGVITVLGIVGLILRMALKPPMARQTGEAFSHSGNITVEPKETSA
jgi:protein SCO1/2